MTVSQNTPRVRAKDYPELVQPGIQYAQKVARGDLVAPKYVVIQAKRFLHELAHPPDGFVFDAELASHPVAVCECLPHVKGPRAGKPISLEPWQVFFLIQVFGWVDPDGYRRFRQTYLAVPRGNGKTTLAAGIAIYCTFVEGEAGAEGYAAAVSRDQARICFDSARYMLQNQPGLAERTGAGNLLEEFGIDVRRHEILSRDGQSSFRALSSENSKALEGLNPHVVILDEIASHKTPEVYDVMLTACGKRANPLMVMITTATSHLSSVGKNLWDYGVRILEEKVQDERFLPVLYAADETEEESLWDEATWQKCNPCWGVSVQPDAVRAIAKQARFNPAQAAAFFTRQLNKWVGAAEALFNLVDWRDCRRDIDLTQFEGRDCCLAIDLSSKVDLTSLAFIFPDELGGYDVFARSYLPQQAVLEQRVAQYAQWAGSGELVVTPGEVTDFGQVKEDIGYALETFSVRGLAYDPWSATQLAQELEQSYPNLTLIKFLQHTRNYSEPTKELDAKIRSKRVRHDGNAVLTWCIGNVVGQYDANDNVFPRKERTESKIDAAIAVIMGIAVALFEDLKPAPRLYLV